MASRLSARRQARSFAYAAGRESAASCREIEEEKIVVTAATTTHLPPSPARSSARELARSVPLLPSVEHRLPRRPSSDRIPSGRGSRCRCRLVDRELLAWLTSRDERLLRDGGLIDAFRGFYHFVEGCGDDKRERWRKGVRVGRTKGSEKGREKEALGLTRSDLGRRDATRKNGLGGNLGAVELGVGVFALDEDGSLREAERKEKR